MNSKIKISKDLEFLRPFIESAKGIIPLYKLLIVRSFKVRPGLEAQTYGSTLKHSIQDTYVINLRVYEWSKMKKKYKPETLTLVLDTLAHELAHLKYFNHSYKHFKTQALISLRFSDIIKKLGIKDVSARFNNLDTTKTFKEKKIEKK